MSNSLDPDQAQHSVGPDLCPNCLQRLYTDDTSRQRVVISQEFEFGPCINFNILCTISSAIVLYG